jgi:hypothetical protein
MQQTEPLIINNDLSYLLLIVKFVQLNTIYIYIL